jgi:hypothetical protein
MGLTELGRIERKWERRLCSLTAYFNERINEIETGTAPTYNNVVSDDDLDLDTTTTYYTFNGTSPVVWTLPPIAGNTKLRIIIINDGTSNVTLNSNAGGNDINDSGTDIPSIVIEPGEAYVFYNNSIRYVIIT